MGQGDPEKSPPGYAYALSLITPLFLFNLEKTYMHTLVVEDHLLVQHALVNLLNAQPDITVVGVARSVQEAVTQARQHSPDCILDEFALESHYTKRIADEFAKSRRPKTA